MKTKQVLAGALCAAAVLAADRVSKDTVLRLSPDVRIGGLFRLRVFHNTGMAFSMLRRAPQLLCILTAVLLALLAAVLIFRSEKLPKAARAGLWLVLGGGLGNLWDRIAYGAVVDFIEPLFVDFAIFNVADIFVCVGVALTAISLLFFEKKGGAHHAERDG